MIKGRNAQKGWRNVRAIRGAGGAYIAPLAMYAK
jgi:hypothetical protein